MNPLSLCLLLACGLNVRANTQCGALQEETDNGCCDKCPAGTHFVDICTDSVKTKCNKCADGKYADKPNMFNDCNQCRVCQQVYAQNCTPTTNAKCSCRKGFLCSSKDCSQCTESRCPAGELMKWTADTADEDVSNRQFTCEPMCSTHEYFDEKQYDCKPRKQCSAFGLTEKFPGNKTHDSVCFPPGIHISPVILVAGIVLLSLALLVFMIHSFKKCYKRHRASKLSKTTTLYGHNSTDVRTDVTVFTKASDAQLSQEECGIKLIIMDKSINGNNPGKWSLELESSSA